MQSDENKKANDLKKMLKRGLSIVIGAWVVIPLLVIWRYGEPAEAGSFGDTFGIVNALFSSLAFALLIYTSMMQREELELQREELRLTREEVAKSAQAQEKLVDLTRQQLELEKLIRRNQIKSELVWSAPSHRVVTDSSRQLYMVQFNFYVRYNPLRFVKIDLRGDQKNFRINGDWDHKMMRKYHRPDALVHVIIEHPGITPVSLDGLMIDICFDDVDGGSYRQTVSCSDNADFFLSNPSPWDMFGSLLS